MKKLFTHPQETWDEETCERRANAAPKDPWGNRPPKGLISISGSAYPSYGQTTRYNGGFIAPDGEHYESERVPLPKIPDTFEIVALPSWGWRIQRKQNQ